MLVGVFFSAALSIRRPVDRRLSMTTPDLLDDDGRASMATLLMMSHHAFRRDLASFAGALDRLAGGGDTTRVGAICDEWTWFHAHLHGHHEAEDRGVFPGILAEHPEVASTIERLTADHRQIDPLLARGDEAFRALRAGAPTAAARQVMDELRALLDPHLASEEAELIPHLRDARSFPPPASDEMAAEYAEGFAWAMHGIAPEVLASLPAMLPAELLARLPAARAAFTARCERAWGTSRAGAARTPIPTL